MLGRNLKAGPATGGKRTQWICKCDCGGDAIATGHELAARDTTSCGCVRKESIGELNRTHALSRTPTYRSWQAMKERCGNPQNAHYENYGARGILVCERWATSFENFLADMGKRPNGKTIDRIDVNGPYEPSNCRWATPIEQNMNTRIARKLMWRGKRMTTTQIAALEQVPASSLRYALRAVTAGDIEMAVFYVKSHRRA